MNIEQQVTSLEISKRLKELGVKQNGIWYWEDVIDNFKVEPKIRLGKPPEDKKGKYKATDNSDYEVKHYSAFTVAELGNMLPEKTIWRGYSNTGEKWTFEFGDYKVFADTEADARGEMLIYLLENKLITP